MIISSTLDFREAARRRLPRFLFDYADGGANSEYTLQRNVQDLGSVALRQRVLQGGGAVDLRTTLFGHERPLPVMLAPVGIAGMYRRRGETQAARAARAAGIPFTLSTVSLCSLTEVVQAAGNEHVWFQLYVTRDRAFMRDLLAKAQSLGVQTLVFTVDMPVPGARYRDARSGMSGPRAPLRRILQAMGKPGWAWDVGLRGRPHQLGNLQPLLGKASGLNDYMGWLGANFDPSIVWKDLDWIRAGWKGPLIIKGVLDPEDARAAADIGADGIVVSNHGGRQLDTAPATCEVLPRVVDLVGDACEIYVDGGVRRGSDVLKAIALGARAVLVGRPILWGMCVGGEQGATRVLEILRAELDEAMLLCGCTTLKDINRGLLTGD